MQKTSEFKIVGTMFNALISKMDKDDINEILFNWNESELNDDGTEIRIFVNTRERGPKTGGASRVKKTEFFNWLLSDAPFDVKVYGEKIREDNDWSTLITKARECCSANNTSGLRMTGI